MIKYEPFKKKVTSGIGLPVTLQSILVALPSVQTILSGFERNRGLLIKKIIKVKHFYSNKPYSFKSLIFFILFSSFFSALGVLIFSFIKC